MAETIDKTYRLVTYKKDWEKAKKEFDCTDEELREAIENELQIVAWSDIFWSNMFDIEAQLKLMREKDEK